MKNYKWIHPPLKLVEEYDETLPLELQITQDHLNGEEVSLYSFDIPEEDRDGYADDFFEDVEGDREAHEAGEEVAPVEVIYGFFISGDTSSYSDVFRDPLVDPGANDVLVSFGGPEHDYPGVYLPIGGHSNGSHKTGDSLISIEDYLAISGGLYTPAVYTCQPVRDWDPHRMLRPKKETA